MNVVLSSLPDNDKLLFAGTTKLNYSDLQPHKTIQAQIS